MRARLSAWDAEAREAAVDHHYQNYFLSVPIDEQVRHAEFVRDADAGARTFATIARTDGSAA